MSTQRLQPAEARPISTQDTPSRRRHGRPVLITAAALTALAAVALTPRLLTTGSHTQTNPTTPPVAAAPHQAPPALAQSNRAGNPASVHGPRAYIIHCENSPTLCASPALKPTNSSYLQFCGNSPSMYAVQKRN